MSPFQYVRAAATLVLAPPLTIIIATLVWLDVTLFRKDKNKALFFPRLWGRILCQLVGAKVQVEGLENISPDQTYIFVGNHSSQFDIFSFQGYYPYDFRWIAKKELFNIPVFGPTMKKVGYIAIDRSKGRQAMKSLDKAAEQIASGNSVLIFPEGTRSPNGKLQEFKTGAILLAIKSGVQVVPIGLNGSHSILPKKKFLADNGKIIIRIGTPIPTDHYKSKDKQALALSLHTAVQELLDDKYKSEGAPLTPVDQ